MQPDLTDADGFPLSPALPAAEAAGQPGMTLATKWRR
jgi:hypothetical protein